MAKKKKKKKEFDASLLSWVPGTTPVIGPRTNAPMMQKPHYSPFLIPNFHMPMPGTSFIENYKLYFFMPTPFEQIGTIADPLGVQDPPQRYLVNPWNIAFDVHADYRAIKDIVAPKPEAPPTMLDPRFFRSLLPF